MKSFIVLAFVLTVFIFLSGCIASEPLQDSLCIEDKVCITIDVADSPAERQQGLMHVESLDEYHGMLFVFEESSKPLFWMKNTLIPLDMIWIDENAMVSSFSHNALPCTEDPCLGYLPGFSVLYNLEVNAGFIKDHNINRGDKVIFEFVEE